MLWFVFPFGGLIIGSYVSTPKLRRRGEEEVNKEGGDAPAGFWVPYVPFLVHIWPHMSAYKAFNGG
jgi:hypothetical protein